MVYEFKRFRVDDAELRLSADGEEIGLEPKTFRVLLYLLQNPNRLVRKQDLLYNVWPETTVTESVLTRSIGLLRKALGDDSREPRFIETVPTVGYRFIAEVRRQDAQLDPLLPVVPPAQSTGSQIAVLRGRTPGFRTAALTGAVAVACAVLAWTAAKRTPEENIQSLAVLPMENLSGDPGQDYFADGMTDELITELAHIPNLRVVSRTSVMQDKGSRKPLRQIADELRVDAVVEGSIVRSGENVRITAQLIDARNDRHLWAQSFEGRAANILELQDSVAGEIASQARAVLLPAPHRAHSVGPAAHDAYLRGRYFFGKQDFLRSAAYFEKATSIDSSYASAFAGLAASLDAEPPFQLARAEDIEPKALAAAKRAIELDPRNGEAYTALGSIQTIYQWDWPEAEHNLLRGIELNPNDSLSEMKYAAYLDAIDRPQEAVTHMRRALDLDPLSFFMTRRLGVSLFYARQYDEALDLLKRASEMEPDQVSSFDQYISRVYEKQGLYDLAVEHDLLALRQGRPKVDTATLSSVYKRDGWRTYWLARIESLRPYATLVCAPYDFGASYARLGQSDQAFFYLNQAIDRHCIDATWFNVDPLLDAIRGDRRYKTLIGRLGLKG